MSHQPSIHQTVYARSRSGRPRQLRPRTRWLITLALFLGVFVAPALPANVSKEYHLKAAFLYNFTKFVEWPPVRASEPGRPILIGVLGRNPFGDELKKIVLGRKVNGREFTVTAIGAAAEMTNVDVLFVCAGEEGQLAAMRDSLQQAGVLTVGESGKFLAAGGIINFTIEGDKVRFVVNLEASERARLKLSAQLLKLAVSVRRDSRETP